MNRHDVVEFFRFSVQGSVAEWSKALVLGTSHFGGVGSNPTTIKEFFNAGGTDCSLFTSLMQLAVTKGNV